MKSQESRQVIGELLQFLNAITNLSEQEYYYWANEAIVAAGNKLTEIEEQ